MQTEIPKEEDGKLYVQIPVFFMHRETYEKDGWEFVEEMTGNPTIVFMRKRI